MTSLLTTLRDSTPQPTPEKFLHWQPGCWIQYYDDTAAKDPAKALSVPTFDPVIAERKQREHCAVGFSLQAFKGGRTREKFLSFRNLGVDVDLIRAPERWSLATAEIDRRKEEYLEQCLRPFPLRPHWLVETRHGFHAIFRVLPVTKPWDVRAAEELNRRLVQALRGDENAVLLTQVLRVPGTYQFKNPAHPFLCRLLQDHATTIKPYPLDVVRHALAGREPPGGAGVGGRSGPDAARGEGRKWAAALAGVPEGQRNSTAASVAGAVLRGVPEELWEIAGWGGLLEWNRHNAVPLPERELRAVFESIARRERIRRREIPKTPRASTAERAEVRVREVPLLEAPRISPPPDQGDRDRLPDRRPERREPSAPSAFTTPSRPI